MNLGCLLLVVFRLVVFRPFPSEVILAKVKSSDEEGIRRLYSQLIALLPELTPKQYQLTFSTTCMCLGPIYPRLQRCTYLNLPSTIGSYSEID